MCGFVNVYVYVCAPVLFMKCVSVDVPLNELKLEESLKLGLVTQRPVVKGVVSKHIYGCVGLYVSICLCLSMFVEVWVCLCLPVFVVVWVCLFLSVCVC